MTISRSKVGAQKEQEFAANCKYHDLFAIRQHIPSRYVYRRGGMVLTPLSKAPYDFVVIDQLTGLSCLVEIKSVSTGKRFYLRSVLKESQIEFFEHISDNNICAILVIRFYNKWFIKTPSEIKDLLITRKPLLIEHGINFASLVIGMREYINTFYGGTNASKKRQRICKET